MLIFSYYHTFSQEMLEIDSSGYLKVVKFESKLITNTHQIALFVPQVTFSNHDKETILENGYTQ